MSTDKAAGITAERMEEIRRRAGLLASTLPCNLAACVHEVRALAAEDVPSLLSALEEARRERDEWKGWRASAVKYGDKVTAERDALAARVAELETDLADARERWGVSSAALLMVGAELAGDPKIDPEGRADPRWTPTLAYAGRCRKERDLLAGRVQDAEARVAELEKALAAERAKALGEAARDVCYRCHDGLPVGHIQGLGWRHEENGDRRALCHAGAILDRLEESHAATSERAPAPAAPVSGPPSLPGRWVTCPACGEGFNAADQLDGTRAAHPLADKAQALLAERRAKRAAAARAVPAPRYDAVFFCGVEALDRDGEPQHPHVRCDACGTPTVTDPGPTVGAEGERCPKCGWFCVVGQLISTAPAPAADPLCARELPSGQRCRHPLSEHLDGGPCTRPGNRVVEVAPDLECLERCPCPGFVPPCPDCGHPAHAACACPGGPSDEPEDGPKCACPTAAPEPSGVGDGGTATTCETCGRRACWNPGTPTECAAWIPKSGGSNTEGGEGC